MSKTVFITGATGYIGGSILHELVQNHGSEYIITALVRSQANVAQVKAAGAATIVVGSYDQPELLVNAVKESDVSGVLFLVERSNYLLSQIIIHTADSSDHFPSAKALIQGISERHPTLPPVVYIHTSGTGVLTDESHGEVEGTKVYDQTRGN